MTSHYTGLKLPTKKIGILFSSLLVALTVITGFFGVVFLSPQANASGVVGWQAGNIIDDSIMTRKNSMTAYQIQTFLSGKVPSCDTNGQKLSEYGGPDLNGDGKVQRWEWGKAKYNQTKFICLKDYKVSDGRSAAKVIYDTAQKYAINPQVLIVLLQKEQGLVTDTWPLNIQYRSATGYGCPDTAPCDSQYYGLVNQLDWAAKMFRAILNNSPTWYTPYVLGNNYIQYNPNSSCGGSTVKIENRSTQALYNYTPYQPNKGALDAGWGTAPCGAYGNRNFYLYFTNWFGSTRDKSLQVIRSLWVSPADATTSDTLAASFILKNSANYAISLSEITVALRDKDNNVVNFPHIHDLTIQPGQQYEYYQRRTVTNPGAYRAWIAARLPSGDWSSDWPYSSSGSIVRSRSFNVSENPDVTLSRSLYFSRSDEYTTEDTSASSFVVKNNDSKAVTIKGLSVAAKHENGTRYDFPSVTNITLQPGQEYEYYGKRILPAAGTYTIWAQVMDANGKWSSVWPPSDTTSIIRQKDIQINDPPDISMVRHLYVSPKPILAGQRAAASFVIKNNEASQVTIKELAVRVTDDRKGHHDFPSVTNLTLNPGQEYTYYQYNDDLRYVNNYTFWVSARVNTDWSNTWPRSINTSIVRKKVVGSRLPNVTISRSLYESPHTATIGQQKGASFIVKNNESRDIVLTSIGAAARYQDGSAVNFPFAHDVTIGAGDSYEYYGRRTFDKSGRYSVFIANYMPTNVWSYSWPYSANDSIVRSRTFSIL